MAIRKTNRTNRVFDTVCAAVGLVLVSPAFLIIAGAIKVYDGGPVFYGQTRIGRHFRPFRLYKFRSMITDADRGGLLTGTSDSRVTRVGRVLRKYKLDELPQLFNVVRGDMQLVGARPEVERYVSMFKAQYAKVLQEAPGITDPASLAFRREEELLSLEQIEVQYVQQILPAKLQLSLAYQATRTFKSDIRILFETVTGLCD